MGVDVWGGALAVAEETLLLSSSCKVDCSKDKRAVLVVIRSRASGENVGGEAIVDRSAWSIIERIRQHDNPGSGCGWKSPSFPDHW